MEEFNRSTLDNYSSITSMFKQILENFTNIRKKFTYFNFVNFYKFLIKDLLFFKFYNKKRAIIRNSYRNDTFLTDFFRKTLDYVKIKDAFFNKNIFAYSNIKKKPNIIEILKENCSTEIKTYIKYANKIIEKDFSIFEKKYKFENDINWFFSFFNDFKWKLGESERINLYAKDIEVDVKYVWEFNRHQFLTYLGFSYYYTKNEKYAKEFRRIILDWIKKNPPLYGINWYSGLEISIRLTSWIFTLYFFKESKEINNVDFFKKIFRSMFQHAYFLNYFHTRRSFNHTVGDLFGVYLFSKTFEEIKSIRRWERKFFNKFKRQIILQTRADGTNIEQSVNYHRFVLEFFTLFLIMNSNNINKEDQHLIEKMYDFLLLIIKPNGNFPLVGDFDDGKVLLLTHFEDNSFIDLLNLGTILFRRGDLKYISKQLKLISILFLGKKGFEIFEKLRIREPVDTIKVFKNAGYFVIRDYWSNESNYLFVDFGRFGPQNAPHSHSSITNFIFSYKGKDIIIDSGTYTYNKSWKDRNLFRKSRSHNVLTINKQDQAKISHWFAWKNKPKIKRRFEIKNGEIKLFCLHDGYKGFVVKRTVITKNSLNSIIIKDFVVKTRNNFKKKVYDIDIYFHFNRELKVKVEENNVIVDNELCFKISSEQIFDIDIQKSFYAPKYGFKYENPMLVIHIAHSFEKNRNLEVTTKIEPLI